MTEYTIVGGSHHGEMLEFLGRRVLVYGYTKMSQEELLVKYITRNGDTND